MSYLYGLGYAFLKHPLNTSRPIDWPPDLPGEKIFYLLFLERLDGPMIDDGKLGGLNLNLLQQVRDLFS